MKILFLHGWTSVPGSKKPSYLIERGHTVVNPSLPDEDFDASIRIAEAEYRRHQPDVIVGSSRGGAVAVNMNSGNTPLVLLCPAWKNWGSATAVKPLTTILHSRQDDVIPFADSRELVVNSDLPQATLIEVGSDHRLADPASLATMLAACQRSVKPHNPMLVRDVFPQARFSPPATPRLLADAESALGVTLPECLRALYLQCDGFREPLGNAKYLFSLLDEDTIGSLVTMTRFHWNELKTPALDAFVFFGCSSDDACWGINRHDPSEIVAYHHQMGDGYEIAGRSILEAWQADFATYDQIIP